MPALLRNGVICVTPTFIPSVCMMFLLKYAPLLPSIMWIGQYYTWLLDTGSVFSSSTECCQFLSVNKWTDGVWSRGRGVRLISSRAAPFVSRIKNSVIPIGCYGSCRDRFFDKVIPTKTESLSIWNFGCFPGKLKVNRRHELRSWKSS